MKDQTFGVEIEMNNIRRDTAAKIIAEFFGTNHYEYTASVNGYFTWSAWDQQGREWKFQRDVSIAGPDAEKCEMVTPILHYDDIEFLQEVVRQLRHAGAKSDDTRGCGVHIHVGGDGHTPQSLRHLVNMMAAHEKLIISAIRIANHRLYQYCKPVCPEFVKRINAEKPKTMEKLEDIWYEANGFPAFRTEHYNNSRYHMLNLHSFFHGHGTIEFRLFQFDRPGQNYKGGLHAGKLKAYIQFCLAICDAAKHAKASRPDHVQCDNMKYAMTGWLCRMGLVGEEFDTLRKTFNHNLTGNAAKRYVDVA